MLDESTTLRDTLEAAVETVAPEGDISAESFAPQETAGEAAARVERARDEAGRFTKAERDAQQAASEAQGEAPAPRLQRPSSWKKDYQAQWDKMVDTDPQMAQYLLEREQQFASGVSTYKAEADRARDIQSLIEPHAPRFQHYGVDSKEYLGRLLKMDELLATGTPQQKIALLQGIARSVGLVDDQGQMQEFDQQQASYIPPELVNTVYGLQSKLQAIEQANERAEQTRINAEIDDFAQNAFGFDELTEEMAQLLETGLATDLKDAHKKALRWNDELFSKYQAEQQQGGEAARRKAAQETAARARSSAVSPRSSTPTGAVAASTQGSDIRSLLENATNSVLAGGGRI
jgi:hypothetical protein